MADSMQISLTQDQIALIDTSDFPKVSAFKWQAQPNGVGGFYAAVKVRRADGIKTTLYMHRLIMGAASGTEVDHLNHDTLDNRRENLRVGSHKENMQNSAWALKTHCPKGHPYDEANTYVNKKGKRICRACNALRVAKIYSDQTPEQVAERLAKNNANYYAKHNEYKAKQREYALAHKDEKRAYDRARRAALAAAPA